MSAKNKILLILVLLIGISLFVSSFYLRRILLENEEAQLLKGNTEQLAQIQSSITDEYNRCTGFLLQEEGEFAQFEYCKQFISWVDTTVKLDKKTSFFKKIMVHYSLL